MAACKPKCNPHLHPRLENKIEPYGSGGSLDGPGTVVGEESVLPCRREPKMNQKASRMVIRGALCAAGVAAVECDEDPMRSNTYSTMDTMTKAPSVQIHTMGDRGFRNCRTAGQVIPGDTR